MKKILNFFKNRPYKTAIALVVMVVYYFALPKTLFLVPYATVVEAESGELLGAKIADDGQWRFPASDSVPYKFQQSIIYFEDQYFKYHPGVNPISISKAALKNLKNNKVTRGGSTLTQQVIRLHRNNKKRTFYEKIIEMVLATRLEFKFSKSEILKLYASHAPFGGNVVGLEMAAYRYFGLPAHQLSWAEAATLAVLPNAPSLIFPGKNQEILRNKRNALLQKLHQNNVIDKETYQLALLEDLPQKPFDLPTLAPHLVIQINKKAPAKKIQTTIDLHQQQRINDFVSLYYQQYKQNQIFNIAVLVANVNTKEIIAYVGNSPTTKQYNKDVDIIPAPRSTGSILKPFLYASMLNDGDILPKTLIPDIPTQISEYTPQNFDNTYDGAVSADRALSRSLNIPSVLMLKDYTVPKFYENLKKLQLTTLTQQPAHYGLSLILGGAEANLYDLCNAYATLGATLNTYNSKNIYEIKDSDKISYLKTDSKSKEKSQDPPLFSAGSIYHMFNAMKEVNRPEGDEAWRYYDSSIQIAWKTGTSFGNRDAWAVGIDQNYVVGVWVGNATGEGRPNLTGVQYAGPILFDVFRGLPNNQFFKEPKSDLQQTNVCKISGHLANSNCPTHKMNIPKAGINSPLCPYHQTYFTDFAEQFRVNASCESLENIKKQTYFVLPPVMQHYYKSAHSDYKILPPMRPDCVTETGKVMEFIYPKSQMILTRTKDQYQNLQPIIAKLAHNNAKASVSWYLNATYLGTTKTFHEMHIASQPGIYKLLCVDEVGNETNVTIQIN